MTIERSTWCISIAAVGLAAAFTILGTSNAYAEVGDDFNKDGLKYIVLTEEGNGGTVSVAEDSDMPKNINIPSTVEKRGITYSVTKIENSAFSGCEDLKSITIPDSVSEIGESAFEGCDSLKSIVLGKGITVIGESAFSECVSLKCIVIPESVTEIGESAFEGCDSLKSIVLGKGVTVIGESAFSECVSLKSIVIPNSVTKIGESAFEDCVNLKSVVLGKSVTVIGEYAFSECVSLKSIVIPDSVREIGMSAFEDCDSLESVVLGKSVIELEDDDIFSECCNLKSITVSPDNPVYSSENGVLFNKNKTILIQYPIGKEESSYIIPDSVKEIEVSAFNECSSLTSITVNPSNTKFSSEEGVLFDKDKTTLIKYPIGKEEKSYTIPNSVTKIEDSAFSECGSLESITIPDSVTEIGIMTFFGCSRLKSITIPGSIKKISVLAFTLCSSLESITIPDGVAVIGYAAFSECFSLESITLPDTVTEIGKQAFFGCESLKRVYYKGNAPKAESKIYHATPDTLTSYYSRGNDTWKEAIKDGKWAERGTAEWDPKTNP
ncbi:MAG: leucine-rich repeat domain-containing protein [Verrucomicrobia bacterium]|nr:leucine-rich repeat domain-containing protein [Verrucomicrobiota bacterium]